MSVRPTVIDRALMAIGQSGETPEDDCFCDGMGIGYHDGVPTGPCVSCCPLAYTMFKESIGRGPS